jgi:hypothetical protein
MTSPPKLILQIQIEAVEIFDCGKDLAFAEYLSSIALLNVRHVQLKMGCQAWRAVEKSQSNSRSGYS